jgi:hypothetical protein
MMRFSPFGLRWSEEFKDGKEFKRWQESYGSPEVASRRWLGEGRSHCFPRENQTPKQTSHHRKVRSGEAVTADVCRLKPVRTNAIDMHPTKRNSFAFLKLSNH